MKDANRSTRIDGDDKQTKEAPKPPQPGKEHRAEPGTEEHRESQRELGVGADHLSDEMRRDQRGTFP